MVSNTRSVLFGLVLGAARLSSAASSDSMVAFTSPIYPTATDSIPPLPASTDECLAKCNKARDECGSAPNANQATCSAEFAACVGYNPYENGNYVPPTACSVASGSPTATAPVDACVKKCNKARSDCDLAPDANHATCAAEYADCLGYNPYNGKDGALVPPTACAAATTMASATSMASGTSMPTGGATSKPAPTEPAVIVNGAGRVSSVKVAGVVGAIGVAVLAYL
ncbi:hypothetical protein FGRMN_130 [Fusarium graminum]|nr:hypothetical protein FGRMN_130 [Fusarium graminum]